MVKLRRPRSPQDASLRQARRGSARHRQTRGRKDRKERGTRSEDGILKSHHDDRYSPQDPLFPGTLLCKAIEHSPKSLCGRFPPLVYILEENIEPAQSNESHPTAALYGTEDESHTQYASTRFKCVTASPGTSGHVRPQLQHLSTNAVERIK
jgi:hypothetical protein